jgi:hypothetical protein
MRITIVISMETDIVSALSGMYQVLTLTWIGNCMRGKQFANDGDLRQRALGSGSVRYDGVSMGDPQEPLIALGMRSLRQC